MAGAVVGAALAVGVGAVVLWADDNGDLREAIERPTLTSTLEVLGEATELRGLTELPSLPREIRLRSPAPERQRETPLAPSAEVVEATDHPQTELLEANAPSADGDAFSLSQTTLVNKGNALWIAEPNVASKGDRMMVVWNHGAAFSSDGGQTFTFVDPRTFPQDKGEYCCDQVALYVPSHDLWVWFIQYWPAAQGEPNLIRLAFARGDEAFDARQFSYYDFTSANFEGLGEVELDYPNLSATNEHLFLAINACADGRCTTSLVVRFRLDEFVEGQLEARYLLSALGTAEFADGEDDVMYFAQHLDSSTLRVFTWPDSAESPESRDVAHSSYTRSNLYTCEREGAAQGTGNWCVRLKGNRGTNDDRPSDGWVSGDRVGFAWNAAQLSTVGFPYPFVMVVLIDADTMEVVDEPHLWNSEHAYQYGTFAPNADGDLGGIVLAGGGDRFQTCATVISDDAGEGRWEARIADRSDADPARNESGDFLGVVRERPDAQDWVATCMTLHGGGDTTNVEVRLFKFGRSDES